MDLATFVHVHVTFLVGTSLLAYDEVRRFEGNWEARLSFFVYFSHRTMGDLYLVIVLFLVLPDPACKCDYFISVPCSYSNSFLLSFFSPRVRAFHNGIMKGKVGPSGVSFAGQRCQKENYRIRAFKNRKRVRSTAYDVFKGFNGRTNYSNEKGVKNAPPDNVLLCSKAITI